MRSIHLLKSLDVTLRMHLQLLLGMATERVTRHRTGAELLGTGTVRDRFRTGPNRGIVKPPEKSCRNRETAGKNCLNRT